MGAQVPRLSEFDMETLCKNNNAIWFIHAAHLQHLRPLFALFPANMTALLQIVDASQAIANLPRQKKKSSDELCASSVSCLGAFTPLITTAAPPTLLCSSAPEARAPDDALHHLIDALLVSPLRSLHPHVLLTASLASPFRSSLQSQLFDVAAKGRGLLEDAYTPAAPLRPTSLASHQTSPVVNTVLSLSLEASLPSISQS